MNSVKQQLIKYTIGLRSSIARFYIAFAHSFIMFALSFLGSLYLALTNTYGSSVYDFFVSYNSVQLIPGLLTAVFTVVLAEKLCKTLTALKIILPCAISAVIVLYFQSNTYENFEYIMWAIAGYCFFIVCSTIFLLYTPQNSNFLFSHIVKVAVFSTVVSTIIMLGIFICVAAVNELFLSSFYYNESRVYGSVFNFCWQVLGVTLLLSGIPKQDDELKHSSIIYTLSGVVFLPIYLLLIFILNIYCLTILITWQLPSGTINWFASFALMFCVYFGLLLPECKNRLIRMAIRILPFTLIPIITVQIICIWVRFQAYGLTETRYLSLAFIAAGISAIVVFIFNKSHKMFFACTAIIAFIVTLTPLNIINVPYMEQSSRFINVLEKYDLIDENNGVRSAEDIDIAQADFEKLESSFMYLRYSDAKKSDFITNATQDNFKDTFGIKNEEYDDYDYHDYNKFFYGTGAVDGIELSGYTKMYTYDSTGSESDGIIDFKTDDEHFYYDLTKELMQFYELYKDMENNTYQNMELILDDGNKVIIDYIDFDVYESGHVELDYVYWYLLVK